MPMHKERMWIEKERRDQQRQRELERPQTPEDRAKISAIIAEIRAGLTGNK